MLKLTKEDIIKGFDRPDYQRGFDYFNNGFVLDFNYRETPFGWEIESCVAGSGGNSYEQDIKILNIQTSGFSFLGNCDCPVEFNCKHVVAACLTLQSELNSISTGSNLKTISPKKPTLNEALNWLDNMAATYEEVLPNNEREEFIAYLLDFSRYSKNSLEVTLVATKPLKKGGLNKGRRIQPYTITAGYSNIAESALPEDHEICQLLDTIANSSMRMSLELEGEVGCITLFKILNTDRCFWQSTQGNPVSIGEERPLKLHWQNDQKNQTSLKLSIEPAGELLLTTPLLYVDETNPIIGMVSNAPYTLAQIKTLQQTPSIPLELVDEFSRKLVTTLPGITLPPPSEVKLTTIENETPQPILTLFGEMDSSGRHTHLMRLRFAYQTHELSVHPQTEWQTLEVDNVLLRIQRDLPAEDNAIDSLIALGFDPLSNSAGDLAFASYDNITAEAAKRWQLFLDDSVPVLKEQGWQIEIEDSFQLKFHQAQEWDVEIEGDNDWFDLRFDIEIKGQKQPLLPLIVQVLSEYDQDNLPEELTIPLGEHEYLSLPSAQIKPVLDILYELYSGDSLSDNGTLKMSRFDAARLAELDENSTAILHWQGGEALRELGKKLKNFKGITNTPIPKGLQATLRDYQQIGLNWLQFLREYQFGGVLADDMGLGKTVQTLAHLLVEKSQRRMNKPCLIIAPTSLMSNWRREAEQFTPELKVLVLQGANRRDYFDQIEHHDLVLSTYPLLVRDEDILLAHDFYYVILDEAQVIKNPRSKAAKVVRNIKAEHRLCLTGTPMENHLGELWSLFDFVMPGLLGNDKQFKQLFRTPIEKHGNAEQQTRLTKRIAPFMLRRTKTEVVSELPEKTEIISTVRLGKKQATLYESIRLTMEKKVQDSIASKGLGRSHIMILDALLKLRQTCCDPAILSLKQAHAVKESAKMEWLMDTVPEMLEEGRRILLFSQFTKMLTIIENALIKRGIAYSKLTGQTRKRDEAIEKFKSGEANIFLISLKAGGVGLNLAEADTVIHYDPWWNPAAENQATDRAHRIGQKNPVFVYKLITENTLEEKILAMQAKKQALAQGIYGKGKKEQDAKLTAADLKTLFEPLQ
ncbi:DNA/RNA helicases, SNF2 family [hydrothermal vent metagenome]|uniref:DNA/RNA helicases, SNF2 family n=1 Tax=hydrothermal vent metagenome TaxID=652676 RepID=A0A3B0WYY8_9ZZZZ